MGVEKMTSNSAVVAVFAAACGPLNFCRASSSPWMSVPDQSQLNSDLVRLYRLITSGAPLAPEDRLAPGMWVEITSGPLTGLTGQIIRRGGNARFVVEVQFIQRGVSAELEGWTIQPIEPPPGR